MSEPMPSADQLRHLIEAAFAEAQYPGDEQLVQDMSGYHLECNYILAEFRGKHWRDLPVDFLLRHAQSIFFLTPEAYRFYLPAYLIAAAAHYDEVDIVPHSVVFSLIVPADPRLVDSHRRRMEGFTEAQRNALRSFLEFMKQNYGEDDLLGDYDEVLTSLKKTDKRVLDKV